MAKKNTKQSSSQLPIMFRLAETAGTLAGKIKKQKKHLVEMANGAIESIKADFRSKDTKGAKKTIKPKAPNKKASAVSKTTPAVKRKASSPKAPSKKSEGSKKATVKAASKTPSSSSVKKATKK